MLDPRWQRSRTSLIEAMLELAAEQSVNDISVQVLAKRAGVDRTTFYNHAKTPLDLISQVLREEMEENHNQWYSEVERHLVSPQQLQEQGFRIFLTHVDSRRAIFRQSTLGDGLGLLETVLIPFLREKIRTLLDDEYYSFDTGVTLSPLEKDMAAQGAASHIAGMTMVWLRSDEKLSFDDLITSFKKIVPSWLNLV